MTGRVRIVDAEPIARQMREQFTKKPVRRRTEMPFSWPAALQHVGDSIAVGYASDKWKADGDWELFKHLSESRNSALLAPEFLVWDSRRSVTMIGPRVRLDGPMPRHFAPLGLLDHVNLVLFTEGCDEAPRFGRGRDAGVVEVEIRHGLLGGGKILWMLATLEALVRKNPSGRIAELAAQAKAGRDMTGDERALVQAECSRVGVDFRDNQPFLFVYTEHDGDRPGGVHGLIVGEKLDIEPDGIVG